MATTARWRHWVLVTAALPIFLLFVVLALHACCQLADAAPSPSTLPIDPYAPATVSQLLHHLSNGLPFFFSKASASSFLSSHYQLQPLHVRHNVSARFHHLLTVHQLNILINSLRASPAFSSSSSSSPQPQHPDIQLVRRVRQEDGEDWTEHLPTHNVSSASVAAALSSSHSLVFNRVHRYHHALAALSSLLSHSVFGHPVTVNAYLTPARSAAFEAHYDWMDIVVLQVEGEKQWTVWEPLVKLPRQDQKRKVSRQELRRTDADGGEQRAEQLRMQAGDVLYLPRGYLHEARNDGDALSLHLSCGIEVDDGFTMQGLLHHALQRWSSKDSGVNATLSRRLAVFTCSSAAAAREAEEDVTVGAVLHLLLLYLSSHPSHFPYRHALYGLHHLHYPDDSRPVRSFINRTQAQLGFVTEEMASVDAADVIDAVALVDVYHRFLSVSSNQTEAAYLPSVLPVSPLLRPLLLPALASRSLLRISRAAPGECVDAYVAALLETVQSVISGLTGRLQEAGWLSDTLMSLYALNAEERTRAEEEMNAALLQHAQEQQAWIQQEKERRRRQREEEKDHRQAAAPAAPLAGAAAAGVAEARMEAEPLSTKDDL